MTRTINRSGRTVLRFNDEPRAHTCGLQPVVITVTGDLSFAACPPCGWTAWQRADQPVSRGTAYAILRRGWAGTPIDHEPWYGEGS